LAANRSFASHASTDNLQLLREAAVANHCEEALIARALLNQEFAPDESVEDAFANLGGRIPKVLNQGIFR